MSYPRSQQTDRNSIIKMYTTTTEFIITSFKNIILVTASLSLTCNKDKRTVTLLRYASVNSTEES